MRQEYKNIFDIINISNKCRKNVINLCEKYVVALWVRLIIASYYSRILFLAWKINVASHNL